MLEHVEIPRLVGRPAEPCAPDRGSFHVLVLVSCKTTPILSGVQEVDTRMGHPNLEWNRLLFHRQVRCPCFDQYLLAPIVG